MSELLEKLAQLHRDGEWQTLIGFYGPVIAVVLLVIMFAVLLRGRRLARRALAAVRELEDVMRGALGQLDELERRIERRLEERAAELDTRVSKKTDERGDAIQERVDRRCAALSDTMGKLDARVSRAGEEVTQFRERVREVEGRIPGLFDRLEDFRDTLAKTFQVELGSVLNSFDNSVGAILHQMKSEMQVGISRIESIEGMVRSRQAAEQTLLGAAERPELPESPEQEEQEPEEAATEPEQPAVEQEIEDDLIAAALADGQDAEEPAEPGQSDQPESGMGNVQVDVAPGQEPEKSHYPPDLSTLDDEDLFLPDEG